MKKQNLYTEKKMCVVYCLCLFLCLFEFRVMKKDACVVFFK